MTRLDSAWRAFYLATPCDCDRQLVHDLARLEYVQRTLDTVGGAFVGEEGSVHLDDDVKRALVGRVERWLKESADRRKAELHARVEAAKEKEK